MKSGRDRIITFTTDFGITDHYVAVMKGVAHAINHQITCIDITHALVPHDIGAGAYTVSAAYRWFPEGTIHVAVVDPGVGTDRRALVIRSKGHTFVGPDNGIFTSILEQDAQAVVYAVTNRKYQLPNISKTFHGRDVFSPVAAWLSKGVKPMRMGKVVTDAVKLTMAPVVITGSTVTATVIHIDQFGNIITNCPAHTLEQVWDNVSHLMAKEHRLTVAQTYAAGDMGTLLILAGSSGLLEIACNGESAAQKMAVQQGDQISLTIAVA